MSINTLIEAQKTHLTDCLPDDYIDEAIAKMVDAGRNAVAVIDDDLNLVGILTDHDIIRALHHANIKSQTVDKQHVSSWMTTQVITCNIDTPLSQALNLMAKHKIHHLIAMDGKRPAAVVSIRDILGKIHNDDALQINVLRDMALASRVGRCA